MVEFKEGDTVMLISGGPMMTVDEVHPFEIHCVWFSGAKMDKKEDDVFNPATLKLIKT